MSVGGQTRNSSLESFNSIILSIDYLRRETDQIRDEISLVVKIRVSELSKQLKLKAATEAWLEKALLEMEHRIYLWLYLAIDDIRTAFRDSLRPDQESGGNSRTSRHPHTA